MERSVVSYGAALSAAEKVASIGPVTCFRRIIPVVGCSQETLRILIWEDWGTLGKIWGITTPTGLLGGSSQLVYIYISS